MITFDIETLPTDNAEIIAQLEETITAPGQYKKPESIAEWMKENKESALKELVAKTSFDGLYGRIACIAWTFGGEVYSTGSGMSESQVIKNFFANAQNASVFCGHNIAGFDLPFLRHRSIILGIKRPESLMKAMSAKPWDSCIADTMLMWDARSDKRTSMDKLCKAFGIAGKGDFDGAMVAETWKTDPGKVIEYCKDDVRRTREIYKRIAFM